ncbi:hemin uptake protein HemP [Hoeflea sp. AS16]|uniref:hemin uptake protein HemP n=1 Tax=unclassified Hoeflea TaxID=2614931 RepID=UPI0031819E7E
MDKNTPENSAPDRRFQLSQADRGTDRVIDSRALFGERKEIAIEHDGAVYRLKITKQGKLILNK